MMLWFTKADTVEEAQSHMQHFIEVGGDV
jgi:hypothetical protein